MFNSRTDRRRKLALKHVEAVLATLFQVLREGTDEDIEQLRLSVKQAALKSSHVECLNNVLSSMDERKVATVDEQA